MQLRKVVLGLAAVTLLASCGAKQITKDEAIKLAQDNYDSSNQVYKSVHVKSVTEVTYSDNVPAELRTEEGGTKEMDITDAEQIASFRITSAAIKDMDEKATVFKADGKKLEISSTVKQSELGGSIEISGVTKFDEIGYTIESSGVVKTTMTISSGEEYVITVKTSGTFAWTK